jgi:hypothetical protein
MLWKKMSLGQIKHVSWRQNSRKKIRKPVCHRQKYQLFIYWSSQFSYTGGTVKQMFKLEISKGVQTSSQRITHVANS